MITLTKSRVLLSLITGLLVLSSLGLMTTHIKTAHAQSECLGGVGVGVGVSAASAALFVPVSDAVQQTTQAAELSKECVLDGLAVILRESLIRKITSSIVTWINSGFEGSPAFVTNIDDFLIDTADEAFGSYIYNNTNFAHLCSPFQFDIRFSLALSYSTDAARPTCTLSNIVDNVETAIDDLSVDWDWDVYETITTDPSGNIFSSYIQSQENITSFINSEVGKKQEDVERGRGFLSQEDCSRDRNGNSYDSVVTGGASGPLTTEQITDRERRSKGDCFITTPGSTINDALSQQLNLSTDQLALADEFNEIVGALMGQLAQQAFGRGGVAGLSQRSGGSNSFLSQYNEDARGASQEFSQNISNQTTGSEQSYSQYIGVQNESIQTLLQSKIKVSEAFACYNSKYNTFIDESGQVLSQEEVEGADPDTLTRAMFTNILGYNRLDILQGVTPEFLTSDQSLVKAQEYQAIITRIDNDLLAAEANIEEARNAAEITARYQSRLNTSFDARDTQELYAEYSSAIASVNVDQNLAQAGLQNINAYTDQAVNGTVSFNVDGQVRTGGAVNDLATCQTFNQVVNPQGQ